MHPPLPVAQLTAPGSDLILMRSSGALGELRRDGVRTVLVLCNGLEALVTRTYLAALRAAGWPMPESTSPYSTERSV